MAFFKKATTDASPEAKPGRIHAFSLVGYSVTGEEHLTGGHRGTGNQDSFGTREVKRGIISVVSDGCGSGAHSMIGSAAVVRLALNCCENLLEGDTQIPSPDEFCKYLEEYLLVGIREVVNPLARNAQQFEDILFDSYLCTIWVAVITADWSAIFGLGDGYYAFNDDIVEVKPRAGNEPDYLAYRLMTPPPKGLESIGLKVVKMMDTKLVRHIMIATDGIEPMRRKVDRRLYVNDLLRNPEFQDRNKVAEGMEVMAKPELKLIFRAKEDARGEISAVVREGVFKDDATLVVSVRGALELPAAWLEYRTTFKPRLEPVPVAPVAPVPVLVGAGVAEPSGFATAADLAAFNTERGKIPNPDPKSVPFAPILADEETRFMKGIKWPFRILTKFLKGSFSVIVSIVRFCLFLGPRSK